VQKNILILSTQANLHFITDPAGELFKSLEMAVEVFKPDNDVDVVDANIDVAAFFYATQWSKAVLLAAVQAFVSGEGVADAVFHLFFSESGVFRKVVTKLGKQANNTRLRFFVESSRSRFSLFLIYNQFT
jgi:hypothetical protein